MADEIVLDENGVPMSNGLGGTESSDDTNTGQGGGAAGPTTNSTSGTSGTTTNTTTPIPTNDDDTSGDDMSDAEFVESVVKTYLAFSQIPNIAIPAYEQLVELYVDNKLGFAKLKEKYKKDNPDVDPDEVDKAVDEERKAAVDEFNKDGSVAKDELKKKYDDFQSALAQMNKDLKSLLKESAKVIAEAFMPTTIGLGAPNPLSIVLKLYNGLVKIKKILDRVFTAMALFIGTSKALGLDGTQGYNDIMSYIANLLRPIQNLIAKQEADESFQENVALAEYLDNAKKAWPWGQTNGVNYQDIESKGREGIHINIKGSTSKLTINMWPMEPKDRQKVVKTQTHSLDYYGANSDEEILKTYEAVLKYNDYLGFVTKKFKEEYKQILAVSNENNNTSDSSSTTSDANSSGGNVNNLWKSNTYGLSGLNKDGTK